MEQIKQHARTGRKDGILDDLEDLRKYTGPPADFWMEFMRVCTVLTGSDSGLLIIRDTAENKWKTLCVWPPGNPTLIRKAEVSTAINRVAEISADEGYAWEVKGRTHVTGIRLEIEEDGHVGVAVVVGQKASVDSPENAILKLRMAAGRPSSKITRAETSKP